MALLRRWFALHGSVSARFYVLSGFALMALKYCVDALLVWRVTGHLLSPVDYLNPMASLRAPGVSLPAGLLVAMALWALPFLWIGLTMSVRRAATVGRSPWLGLLFAAPVANFLLIALLALSRSSTRAREPAPPVLRLSASLTGILLGLGSARVWC